MQTAAFICDSKLPMDRIFLLGTSRLKAIQVSRPRPCVARWNVCGRTRCSQVYAERMSLPEVALPKTASEFSFITEVMDIPKRESGSLGSGNRRARLGSGFRGRDQSRR